LLLSLLLLFFFFRKSNHKKGFFSCILRSNKQTKMLNILRARYRQKKKKLDDTNIVQNKPSFESQVGKLKVSASYIREERTVVLWVGAVKHTIPEDMVDYVVHGLDEQNGMKIVFKPGWHRSVLCLPFEDNGAAFADWYAGFHCDGHAYACESSYVAFAPEA
jgi:hypothetical protein